MDENQKKEDWNTFELDETAMIAFSEEDAMILSDTADGKEADYYTSMQSILKDMDAYEKENEKLEETAKQALLKHAEREEQEAAQRPKKKRSVFRSVIRRIRKRLKK